MENKNMNEKIVNFALEFLLNNIADPDVEAMVAVSLGLADCEENYEGAEFENISSLINQAKKELCQITEQHRHLSEFFKDC